MIGSDRAALSDRKAGQGAPRRLGGPFPLLGLLLLVWVAARSILWESPFPEEVLRAQIPALFAGATGNYPQAGPAPMDEQADKPGVRLLAQTVPAPGLAGRGRGPGEHGLGRGQPFGATLNPTQPRMAAQHDLLWRAALSSDARGTRWRTRFGQFEASMQTQAPVPVFPSAPSFVAEREGSGNEARRDRWSLGAWAFARQGGTVAPITRGPAPVYGANQAGGTVQYRFAPTSARDPRAYVRAARALIDSGETEVAAGFSARPLARMPVRTAAELRVTDNSSGSHLRPAFFAITELPPIALPLGFGAEIYAAAGYVGADAATAFVDGQASVTRSVAQFDLAHLDKVRVSLGAGAWGGAQRGARRLDVGPTLRMDMVLGGAPARVSIDYREQVGGQAAPASGVAATLSTQF